MRNRPAIAAVRIGRPLVLCKRKQAVAVAVAGQGVAGGVAVEGNGPRLGWLAGLWATLGSYVPGELDSNPVTRE